MASNKKYWKSVEELNPNSSIVEKLQKSEFIEELPTDEFLGDKESLATSETSRRDFLKYVGFSTAVASLAACEGPVINSIPYVVKPDDLIPGIPDYYATSIADGHDFANVLVKVREGRPIKIEPNKDSRNGATNARVQASVLSLYDNSRLNRRVPALLIYYVRLLQGCKLFKAHSKLDFLFYSSADLADLHEISCVRIITSKSEACEPARTLALAPFCAHDDKI